MEYRQLITTCICANWSEKMLLYYLAYCNIQQLFWFFSVFCARLVLASYKKNSWTSNQTSRSLWAILIFFSVFCSRLSKLDRYVIRKHKEIYPTEAELSVILQVCTTFFAILYSNHLNTGQYGCPLFKWLSHVTWRTIQIPDILNLKKSFFSSVFRPPFKY